MRAAYLITAYNEPHLLDLLVATLEPERRDVFIHLDAKSASEPFRLPHIAQAQMVPRRHSVVWATRSFTDAIMELLKTAMATGRHDYFVLLSGSDYPVRPVAEFEDFLAKADGLSFQMSKPALTTSEGRKRLRSHYVIKNRTMINVALQKILFLQSFFGSYGGRRPPSTFPTYYMGPPWFTVHRDVAQWMLDCWDDEEIRDYFSTVYCAEEIIIPTMIANSPWHERCVRQRTRFIQWQGTARPKSLTLEDLANIKNSGHFFARKMTTEVSLPLLERIGRDVHGIRVESFVQAPTAPSAGGRSALAPVEKTAIASSA